MAKEKEEKEVNQVVLVQEKEGAKMEEMVSQDMEREAKEKVEKEVNQC